MTSESKRVCVIGLGTVGLPTARAIKESGFEVFGYDIDKTKRSKVEDLVVLSEWKSVPRCGIYVVCVPTELERGNPDMSAVVESAKNIAKSNEKVLVCIESTVSPGVSRALSKGLRNTLIVHAPHRYWSRDSLHHGVRQRRVIGALNAESMRAALSFYTKLGVPLRQLASLEEAEMTKLVENAYRFVQIAFAEEVAMLCDELKIDWPSVRSAANTKWNIDIPEARSGIDGCLAKDIRFLMLQSSLAQHRLLPSAVGADKTYRRMTMQRIKSARRTT